MSTNESTSDIEHVVGAGRWAGLSIAAVWLVFLVPVLTQGWDDGPVHVVLTTAALAAFVASYLTALALVRGPLGPPPGTRHRNAWALALMGAMAAAGAAMCLTAGDVGLSAVPYLAVTAVFVLPPRFSWIVGAAIALVGFGVGAVVPGWSPQVGVLFGGCLATLAGWGARRMMRIRTENTRLLMGRQRDRFARDLHDILGHSLTVITVKAELAQKLFDVDPARAKAEIADLERLSRDALADVRKAVSGYREITLPGEIANARAALEAAEIKPLLPQSTDEVPTQVRELFAWTVREGVTNVIRHSTASECEILLKGDRVIIRDNGKGCDSTLGGHGLVGLRERAAAVGATVTTRSMDPGFALEVTA